MATSSMHKPGWRSRRRSRLSLVERAVPRLGRLGTQEDGAKTTPASSKSAPPKHVFQGRSKKTDGLKAEPKAAIPSPGGDSATGDGHPGPTEGPEETAPQSTATSAWNADQAPDRNDDVDDPILSDRDVTLTANDRNISSEVAAEPAFDGGQVDMPSSESDTPLETVDAEQGGGGPDTLLSSPTIPLAETSEKVAAVDASSGPLFELDWDHLNELGYTDPRDRGRPLPREMDDIIRALIRQALSDQSSWRDRVILVTSPNERASKSTAAINFAFGLTTVGNHRAVLVDVDTTGSGAVDRLGGKDFTGMTAVLADESIAIDGLAIKTDLDRLTLVASGAPDDETLDRFASRRMLQILRHLTEDPDTLLVIDAPPILASQEAAVLSVVAGQVVLAVEAGRTTADQIEHALQRIGERHNVSLVLNESNGFAAEDTLSAAPDGNADMTGAMRRAPSAERRLSKPAVVAAGAVVLGLVIAQPVEHNVTEEAFTTSAFSAESSALPERWSNPMAAIPFRQSGR